MRTYATHTDTANWPLVTKFLCYKNRTNQHIDDDDDNRTHTIRWEYDWMNRREIKCKRAKRQRQPPQQKKKKRKTKMRCWAEFLFPLFLFLFDPFSSWFLRFGFVSFQHHFFFFSYYFSSYSTYFFLSLSSSLHRWCVLRVYLFVVFIRHNVAT